MAQATNKPNRAYCFTLNNPRPELLESPETLVVADDQLIRYAVWQLETGEAGTRHFQGYLELRRPCRYTQLSVGTNLAGAHFEPRRGSRDQARDYCRKEESRTAGPWESGTWSSVGQGKRSDLDDVVEMLNGGASLVEIATNAPKAYIKYHRGIERTRELVNPPPGRTGDEPVSTTLFLGPPGCGKTSAIRQLAGPDAYWKDNGKWWYNYTGQRVVVLDDMSGSSLAYRDFKRVCDRYPYTVEYKNGMVPLAATVFYLSSCSMPDRWWNPEHVREYKFEEISRRITCLHVYKQETKNFEVFNSDEDSLAIDKFLISPLSKHY